ncbi:PD-(D/E)XK nuclease family protein [Alkalihalophilus sp. As8PL]|uniref:PD-(D/E)XK nuclease family protein n=1 Tax=Alkalihalophilus sp. As8PL TaxID=3237103 RepID=A0AB39BS33_9BACI
MQIVNYTSFQDVANQKRLKEALDVQRNEEGPVFYLLPSSRWLQEARKKQPGLRYTTFDDLATYIVNEAEEDVIYIGEQERTLFFQNMLKLDPLYRSFNENQSKVKGLADTYGQLKRLGLELEQTPQSLKEFMSLFAQYEDQTVKNQKMYDPENTVLKAVSILKNKQTTLSTIYIDGFIDFSPLQYMLLKALVEAGLTINIYLPSSLSHPIIEGTLKDLEALGFDTSLEEEVEGATDVDVNVWSASTTAEEWRAVLQDIQLAPYSYEEIGIVLVDEREGMKQVEQYAKMYEVPLEKSKKRPLSKSISIQLLMMTITQDFSQKSRFDLLALMDKMLAVQAIKGVEYAKAKEAFLSTGDFIHKGIAELYARIQEVTWRKTSTFYQYIKQVISVIGALRLEEGWVKAAVSEVDTERLKDYIFEQRALEKIEDILSEYAEQLDSKQLTLLEMSLDVFSDWLKKVGEQTELFIERGSRRGVAIHTWRDLGLFKGKRLYVVGMNEGAYPAIHNLGGYVTEKDLYELPIEGALPTQEHFRSKQQAYLEQILYSSEEVIFSYKKGLDPNHPLLPSPFIEEWCQKGVKEYTFESRMKQPVSFTENDQEEKVAFHLGLGKEVRDKGILLERLMNRLKRLETAEEPIDVAYQERLTKDIVAVTELESYARCPFRHGLERVLHIEEAKQMKERISPLDIGQLVHSIIEEVYKELNLVGVPFGECPEELKSQVPILLREKFEVLWGEIEAASLEISRLDLMLAKENWWRKLNRWWQAERKHFWDNPQLAAMKIHALESSVRLELEIEGNKILTLTGKVDRVDVDDSGFAIYDYKTGFAQVKLEEEVRSGLKLQLPLYARAMRAGLTTAENEMRAHGASYISLREPEKRAGNGIWHSEHIGKGSRFLVHHSCKNKEDDLGGDLFMDTYELKEKVGQLWKGTQSEFPVRPLDCSSHCPYRSVCRVTEDQKEGL